MPEAILFYDGRCRFCRWSASKVLGLDRTRRLRPLDLHSEEADEYFVGVQGEEKFGSWHIVRAGRRYSAGRAFVPLLGLLPFGRVPAKVAGAVPSAVDWAYDLVASRRSSLGRLVTEGADRRAAERIEERS